MVHRPQKNSCRPQKVSLCTKKNLPCPEQKSLPTNIKEIIPMERNTKKAKVQVWRGLNFSVMGQAFWRTKDCVTHRESKSDFLQIFVPYSQYFLLVPVHFSPTDDNIPILCVGLFLHFFRFLSLCTFTQQTTIFPFYARLFCSFSSPQAAIYSHQSRPEARPSLPLTYTTATFTNSNYQGNGFLKKEDLFTGYITRSNPLML